jgi:hypothetical protein
MADRFRVSLRRAATFTAPGGMTWRRDQIRIVADPIAAAYYRRQTEFSVEPVREEIVEERPTAPPPPPAPPAPVVTPEPPKTEPDTPSGGGDRFTHEELLKLKKSELLELAVEGFGLSLDNTTRKDVLIAALLKAQG